MSSIKDSKLFIYTRVGLVTTGSKILDKTLIRKIRTSSIEQINIEVILYETVLVFTGHYIHFDVNIIIEKDT